MAEDIPNSERDKEWLVDRLNRVEQAFLTYVGGHALERMDMDIQVAENGLLLNLKKTTFKKSAKGIYVFKTVEDVEKFLGEELRDLINAQEPK